MFGKSVNPEDPIEHAKIFDRFLHKDVFRFCKYISEITLLEVGSSLFRLQLMFFFQALKSTPLISSRL